MTLVLAGCKVNPKYCDDTRPCQSGLVCAIAAHECVPGDGGDMGPAADLAACSACANPEPICNGPLQCRPCVTDSECASASPSTPHCANGSCYACAKDDDCSSKVCDFLPPLATARGSCVDASNVAYVDKSASTNGDGLTLQTPRQKLADGIATAVTSGRLYVRVASGTYAEAVARNGSENVFLVGVAGTVLTASTGTDTITLSGGASMSMRLMRVGNTSPNGRSAINCGGTSTFTAYQSQFTGTSNAIYFDCNGLKLDGCWLDGAKLPGIYVNAGNACNFVIQNSLLTRNMGGALTFAPGATWSGTGLFVNNTVADNGGGASAAASCAAKKFTIVNSILYGNGASSTNCATDHVASDDAAIVPALLLAQDPFAGTVRTTIDDYRLAAGTPCIGAATATGAPDHDFDFSPRPDNGDGQFDIGAFESH